MSTEDTTGDSRAEAGADDAPHSYLRALFYARAQRSAQAYLRQPAKLARLIDRVVKKLSHYPLSPLRSVFSELQKSFRLLKAVARGEYTEVSKKNLLLLVSALVYFLMPVDAIPDFILGYGLIDDVAILAWTFGTIAFELEKFSAWEDACSKLQTDAVPESDAESGNDRQTDQDKP